MKPVIKCPVVVVHGVGGGDAKTRTGYSTKLRDRVFDGVSEADMARAWLEAPWEDVNDDLD